MATNPVHPIERDALIDSIRFRLRPVCAALSETEFDALVERIARIELKYRGREVLAPRSSTPPVRPPMDWHLADHLHERLASAEERERW